MAIIQTVSFSDFERAFINAGRNNQFTHEGLWILYSHLDDSEITVELDVIDLCCSYVELSLDDVIRELDLSDYYETEGLTDDEIIDDAVEQLSDHTSVIGYHYCEKENQYYILFEAY